uniref:Uncharacterized protein n=1 Tax=Rhizophora mucronata TaxID=61149 RepID=A0A2P2NEK9_RHIMU
MWLPKYLKSLIFYKFYRSNIGYCKAI